MDIVFLIYGLSFLALGLVVVIWPREDSGFELAVFINWLAAFAFVHGALEWMDLWRVVRGDNAGLATWRPFVLLASYLLLYEFGRRLVRASLPAEPRCAWWMAALDARVHLPLAGAVFAVAILADDFLLNLGIWSRYLVGTTGSALTGAGFIRYCHLHIRPALPEREYRGIARSCQLAGVAFLAYSFFGGLVVPAAPWAPASWLNYASFQDVVHVPVQVLRTACAVLAAVAVGHMLRVFDIEARLRLRRSLDDAEIALVEVRRLGRRNDLLLNSVGEGIFGIDRQGRTTFVNPAALGMLGFAAEALMGEPIHGLIHHTRPDGSPYPAEECPLSRILEDGRVRHSAQDLYWRKDGSGLPVEYRATPIVQDGRIVGAVVAFQDITERLRADRLLRERNEFLATVLENEPECVKVVGPDGSLLQMNAAGLAMLEADSVQAINQRGLLDFVAPEDRQGFRDLAAKVFGGESGALEFAVVGLGGGRRWLETRAAPLRDGDGRVAFLLGVTRDVTARREAEAILADYRQHLEELVAARTRELSRAKEAAESASIAKSAFLANMSHEIRTPLHAIIGMTHLVRRSGVSPKQGERLDKIDTAGRHLLDTINAILELSKIEAGKFELDVGPVNIAALMANVSSILQERAAAKGLRVVTEAGPMPDLLGDATRLQQGLLNYAMNAVKFTDAGAVVLRARLVDETPDDVTVRFEVEDSGIGIAADVAPRLFAAFEQADNSTTRKYGGSGLGLAITKKLAEVMGGAAGVVSTPGVGSTFWFTARLGRGGTAAAVRQAPPEASAEAALARDFRGRRILLVEDEEINREVTLGMLEDAGLSIDVAVDGVEAVERVGRSAYDLILMDMQMPRMDGLEATRRIRATANGAITPIAAMTANAFAEDRARCMAAGMDDFIAKPVDPEVLFATVLRWLAR